MTTRKTTRFVHEGEWVAETEVKLIETGDGWSPYLTVEEATRLDDLREALRAGDLEKASNLGRVFRLIPLKA